MITCVFGRKGAGKTTWIRRATENDARLVIHDPVGQFQDVCHVVHARLALVQALDTATREAEPFRLAAWLPEDGDADFVIRACLAIGHCTLVLDECDWEASAVSVPRSLKRLVSYCRHWRIDILAGARRPADVPRTLTAQADRIVYFQLDEPADFDYVRRRGGDELLSLVQGLTEGQCVVKDVGRAPLVVTAWRGARDEEE